MAMFMLAIPALLIALAMVPAVMNRPKWLLGGYLVLVPLLPPMPLGSIEITVLDLLAIPTAICILVNLSRDGFEIKSRLVWAFVLVVFAGVLSFISFSLMTKSFTMGIFLRLVRLSEMLLPVILAAQVIRSLKREDVIRMFMYGAAVTAGVGVFMYLNGITLRESQTFFEDGMEIFRAAGTHGNSGSFGSYMGIAIIIAAWGLIFHSGKYGGLGKLSLLTLAVCGAGLMVSLSRGGMVMAAIGIVILLVSLLNRPGKLFKVAALSVLSMVILAGTAFKMIDNERIQLASQDMVERVTDLGRLTEDFETISAHRNVHWEESWHLYKNNAAAWPFGLGYKALKFHYETLPDNNFNQALFEMGLFGLMVLLYLIFTGLRSGFSQLKNYRSLGVLAIALWIGLVSNMISADVITYWHSMPAVMILLVFISENMGETPKQGYGYEGT